MARFEPNQLQDEILETIKIDGGKAKPSRIAEMISRKFGALGPIVVYPLVFDELFVMLEKNILSRNSDMTLFIVPPPVTKEEVYLDLLRKIRADEGVGLDGTMGCTKCLEWAHYGILVAEGKLPLKLYDERNK